MQPMTAATTTMDSVQPSFLLRLQASLFRQWQTMLDNSVPHTIARWIFLVALVLAYMVRVYYLQGFYIVTYGLGIFLLNLFIGFLSPLDDVEGDGPLLPTGSSDEFKPFIRRLPEFKFWLSCVKAMVVGFTMTFFSFFNVPVFWPILLVYFILLFALTMKKQISHMIKHKYLPFNLGKKTYGKEAKSSVLPVPFALGADNSNSNSRND